MHFFRIRRLVVHSANMTQLMRRFGATLVLSGFILFMTYFVKYSTYLEIKPAMVSNVKSVPSHMAPEYSPDLFDELAHILEDKIDIAKLSVKEATTKPACDTNETLANSCDGPCLRMEISENPRERLSQLLNPRELQLTPDVSATLHDMKKKVEGFYDVIILTTSSSNHFLESQAMLKNIHENVFPYLKNVTLVYYNIGLTKEERQTLATYCKCTVVDFPFEKFPEFVQNLKCYSWKPLMIKAHINQGNVLVWMDASVRFNDFAHFQRLVETTKERGFQMAGPSEKNPFRTFRSTYHFFGDEPCAYLQYGQLHATNGYFKNDLFVNRAILEPWAACALHKNCICPDGVYQHVELNNQMSRMWREEGKPVIYGLVHRFDQSAISLIIHKLFYKVYPWLLFDKSRYEVKFLRRDELKYFPVPDNQTNSIHDNY